MSNFTKLIILPILVITILCISAVEGLYYWGERYLGSPPQQTVPANGEAPAHNGDVVVKDLEKPIDYGIIVKRNLFAVDESAVVEQSDSDDLSTIEMSSLDVVLMGTISGTDDEQRAVIYDKKDRRQELYQVGDYIEQAIIKQIMRGKVILNFNGKDEMLDISEARNVNIPQIAQANPVVQTRKVIGRPVGQPLNTGNQVNEQRMPGASGPGVVPANSPKQLRSYRGGVIVKDKPVAP